MPVLTRNEAVSELVESMRAKTELIFPLHPAFGRTEGFLSQVAQWNAYCEAADNDEVLKLVNTDFQGDPRVNETVDLLTQVLGGDLAVVFTFDAHTISWNTLVSVLGGDGTQSDPGTNILIPKIASTNAEAKLKEFAVPTLFLDALDLSGIVNEDGTLNEG
jgi:hypothetical protein